MMLIFLSVSVFFLVYVVNRMSNIELPENFNK